ncbi:hypothetical protein Tco_0473143 [Tanacetum coccineum]
MADTRRYREYDLAHLKLVFEFSIYNVWKSVQYGVSNELDTAYWGFLGVGTTFDIFQNIILIPYLEYGVLGSSGYGVLIFNPGWSFGECRHGYAVSSCWIRQNANPSSILGSLSQESSVTTHAKFTARINKLLEMRQTIDSLLFKTINESTNQSFDSEIFCPEERIKELELRRQRRNNFEEGLFKDKFPTEEELAYYKELLGEPQSPFSTLEPKIRRGDP